MSFNFYLPRSILSIHCLEWLCLRTTKMLEGHYSMFSRWKRNGLNNRPKRNWKQSLCKILEGQQRVFWYLWKRPIQTFKASKVIKARLLLFFKKICLWTKRNFVWLVGKEWNISPVVIWRIYSYVKSWVTRFLERSVMKSREVHNVVKKFSKGTYYSVIWSFFIVFMLKRKQRKTCKWP